MSASTQTTKGPRDTSQSRKSTAPTIPLPGVVVLPNGSKIFVVDKWAYLEKHPEAYRSTQDSIDSLAQAKKVEVERERARVTEKQRMQQMSLKQQAKFDHWCVGRKIPKDCKECNATMKPGRGICKLCKGYKVLYEPCPQCQTDDPVANTLKHR